MKNKLPVHDDRNFNRSYRDLECTEKHTAFRGQPIFSSTDEDMIVAFWTKNMVIENRNYYKFVSMKKLLGEYSVEVDAYFDEPVTSFRSTCVYCERGTWFAGNTCIPADFKDHPDFVVNPISGAEAIYQGAVSLLNHPAIQSMKQNDPNGFWRTLEHLVMYDIGDMVRHYHS